MKNAARIILTAVLLVAGVVQAQNYPGNRPVRILVGYAPGGGVDTTARMMAQALGELWGANVLVETAPVLRATLQRRPPRKHHPTVTRWCCATSVHIPSRQRVLPNG